MRPRMTPARRSAPSATHPALALGLAAAFLLASGCARGTSEVEPPRGEGQPTESLATVLAHADSSFRDADYREAQKAYEEAIRLDPDHGPATTNLANCYLKNRAVRKAEGLLKAYLARHPDEVAARLVLARAFVRQGELGQSADALRFVL